jgi:hypothetical protein
VKWKEALENAVDWLALAESVMNERCKLYKKLCIVVDLLRGAPRLPLAAAL